MAHSSLDHRRQNSPHSMDSSPDIIITRSINLDTVGILKISKILVLIAFLWDFRVLMIKYLKYLDDFINQKIVLKHLTMHEKQDFRWH